jgi:4-hydroxy-2-oxoheptanedioate aldolase
MGVPGQVEHPSVITAIESIVASATTHRMVTAIYAPTPILARRWLSLGVGVVAVGYDTALILEAFKNIHAATLQT